MSQSSSNVQSSSSSSERSFSPPSPHCPAEHILIKIPLVSKQIRNDIKDRIEERLTKISYLQCKLARTSHGNIARKVFLSKAIIEQQGALKELHSIANMLYVNRNSYKIGHAEMYMDHSCDLTHPANTSLTDQEDCVDISDSSASETSDLEEIYTDSELEILEHQS